MKNRFPHFNPETHKIESKIENSLIDHKDVEYSDEEIVRMLEEGKE